MSVAVRVPAAAAAVASIVQPGARVSSHPAPFAVVPSAVLRDASLSLQARALYAILDDRQGASGSVRVRIATLCQDTGASDKSVRRWLDELRAAGLVATQQTGRSMAVYVSNASRTGRTVIRDRADRSPVTGLQRSNSLVPTSSPDDRPQVQLPAQIDTSDDEQIEHRDIQYLAAIESSTGHRLRPTTAVRRHLAAIRRAGTTPAETGAISAAYLAAHGSSVRHPASWLAAFVLDAIAHGQRPQQLTLTFTPPSYMSQLAAEPCEHGEPRGAAYCALCRHVTEDELVEEMVEEMVNRELERLDRLEAELARMCLEDEHRPELEDELWHGRQVVTRWLENLEDAR